MMIEQKTANHLNSLCMIPGSMGLWETYFKQLCTSWGTMDKKIRPYHLIYAADNGIVSEGHIGFSHEITRLHAINMAKGGAAISGLCECAEIPFEVIDAGICSESPIGRSIKAAKGTKNFLLEPAMSEQEFQTVWDGAATLIKEKARKNITLFSFGEMGIGNTTTSAAVLSALANLAPSETVGRGSGADSETLKKKTEIVKKALFIHAKHLSTPESILQHVGGFDLVALTSSMLTSASLEIPYVIDGYISCVAHACAYTINPNISMFAFPSHMSRERGMSAALHYSGLHRDMVPIHAQMALGEGTGAVMMIQLLKMIHFTFLHMTTLDSLFEEKA